MPESPPADAAWTEVLFEVQAPNDGWRVDAFLAARLHRYSRSEVQRVIAAGRVFLRGRLAKPAHRVAAGQRVLIRYPRREEPPRAHQSLAVLHEDQWLLAVAKPGDLLSHPTDKIVRNTVTSILRDQFPGAPLHLVHRLDRETSGVLLLAKDPRTARRLTEQFRDRLVRKEYLALAAGRVRWKKKIVDLPLGREGGMIKVRQAAGVGSPAATEFERLGATTSHSLVLARPRTGRLHQIRAHLAHLGHPIVGDKLYMGAGELYMKAVRGEMTSEDLLAAGAQRQLLHAWRLRLRHPALGSELRLEAPVPADFLEGLARAGLAL